MIQNKSLPMKKILLLNYNRMAGGLMKNTTGSSMLSNNLVKIGTKYTHMSAQEQVHRLALMHKSTLTN
jgi:hypothetical protein